MTPMPRKRIALAQNFLTCPQLARSLIGESSINDQDIVYEIGPGTGLITAELARLARQVIAIEKDSALVAKLSRRFQHVHNVVIVEQDFLLHHIRDREYKVFASIPYNMTAAIVRKLLAAPNPPQAAYLIMQKEAAQKFAGWPQETQFSILTKPWFDVQISRMLARTDFEPIPRVDSVLLQISQRSTPLLATQERVRYHRFVRYGFTQWKKDLCTSYKAIFTHRQWQTLARNLAFGSKATPTQLTLSQWLGLYDAFCRYVPQQKQQEIHR